MAWLSLVSLINVISTFVGYLKLNSIGLSRLGWANGLGEGKRLNSKPDFKI